MNNTIAMSNQGLYYRTQLETKVVLLAEQADADIDEHLFANLKRSVTGKTMENGIVIDVKRILSYDYGVIDPSNFMTSITYNVKYECSVCSPSKDLEIICNVDSIVKGFIFAKNGPIVAAIQVSNIDSNNFTVSDNNVVVKKTGHIVEKGDHLKVSIINVKSNMGEKHITTICKLIAFAKKSEIAQFENEQKMVIGESNDDAKDFF